MIDYSNNIIKKYQFWTVYACVNQEYLGRCVIWCDREDALELTDATEAEMQEFLQIIKELKIALGKAFSPDWFNYSFLWNSDRHLHCHLVPRYKTERILGSSIFHDLRWWSNWLLDESFVTELTTLQEIKTIITNNLSQ